MEFFLETDQKNSELFAGAGWKFGENVDINAAKNILRVGQIWCARLKPEGLRSVG